MKAQVIFYSTIACIVVAAFCFIYKLILWLKLNPASRIGFLRTFFVFFSVHDVHNASSPESKNFRRKNNVLNACFFVALLGLAIVFMFNTDDVNGVLPNLEEKYKNIKGM